MLFSCLLPVYIFLVRLPTVNVLCSLSCLKPLSRGLFSTDNVLCTVPLQLGKQFMESQDYCRSVSRNDRCLLRTWRTGRVCSFMFPFKQTQQRYVPGSLGSCEDPLVSGLSGPPKWAAVLRQSTSAMGRTWKISCCFTSLLCSSSSLFSFS